MRFNYKKQATLCWGHDVNHRNTRFRKGAEYNYQFFEGYRIDMAGRLSRKQRASSYLLICGAVPLNTYSSYIDYGFYTVPLRNSALTVKVWFNKRDGYSDEFNPIFRNKL